MATFPAPFQITQDIRDTYQASIDALIAQLGRPCRLVLEGAMTQCPNCFVDPVNRRSTGQYNGTGPRTFAAPPCPVCKGSGLDPAAEEVTEVRTFLVRWDVKNNEYFPPGTLTKPVTLAKIKGLVDDAPLLMQAKYVVLDYLNAEYTNQKFQKLCEPVFVGSIVAGRYFTCYLQKVE